MSGFLKRLEDTDRETAQVGGVFRAEAGAEAAAILIAIPMDDGVNALDAPMSAVDSEQALR